MNDTTLRLLTEALGAVPEALLREIARGAAAVLREQGPHGDLTADSILLKDDAVLLDAARRPQPDACDLRVLGDLLREACPQNASPFLSSVIVALLAGEFESPDDLFVVLEDGESSEWWAAREEHAQHAGPPVIRVERDAKLFGRDAHMQVLEQAWREAQEGRGQVVVVEGESGIGKTRLVAEFVRRLDATGRAVLHGAYLPSPGSGGLSNAVVHHFGVRALEARLRDHLPDTPVLVPAFAAHLMHLEPPEGSQPLARPALSTLMSHLIRALAARQPTLWIVDDHHFAPQESKEIILSMARAVEAHRAVLLVTSRPCADLEPLKELKGCRRTLLERLQPGEVAHVVADALGNSKQALKMGWHLANRLEGLPFLVVGVARTLRDKRVARAEDIEIPERIEDSVQACVDGLEERQRAVLDVAAVQGARFDPALVATVLDESKLSVLRDLAELERHHGLVHSTGHGVRFSQNQVPEVLYLQMMPDSRANYHTLIAEASATGDPEALTGQAAVLLAANHLMGRRPQKGLQYLDAALDHLERAHRNEKAVRLADQALRVPELLQGAERVKVLSRMAERLNILGLRSAERAALDEANELADAIGDLAMRARARHQLAWHMHTMSNNEEAKRILTEALALATKAGDRRQAALTEGALGSVYQDLGRYAQARRLHEQHLAIAREMEDELQAGRAMVNLGNAYYRLGLYPEALEQHGNFLVLARKLGNLRWEAVARGNIGVVLSNLGDFEQARQYDLQQLEIGQKTGYRRVECVAVGNLGVIAERQGRYDDARDRFEQQLSLAHEINYGQGMALATANLGEIWSTLGNPAEARDYLDHSLELARQIKAERVEALVLSRLGMTAERAGELDVAEKLYREALAKRRDIGNQLGIVECLIWLGRLGIGDGRDEEPMNMLSEALAIAGDMQMPGMTMLAAAYRALLPGGDASRAEKILAEDSSRIAAQELLEGLYVAYRATGRNRYIQAAKESLDRLRQHAPEEWRQSMIEGVPLAREITAAAKAAAAIRADS